MFKLSLLLAVVATAMLYSTVWAQNEAPIGLWKNIDDDTGKPRALIRITEIAGEFRGRIEKVFLSPGEPDNPVCNLCEGEFKDQPIVGLTILFGMRREGGEYNGGRILDPDNGKLYRCRMVLTDDGSRLNIRGYIGIPMLGRSQIWLREE
jgi:uncharacterized protein (DUF2147 family)